MKNCEICLIQNEKKNSVIKNAKQIFFKSEKNFFYNVDKRINFLNIHISDEEIIAQHPFMISSSTHSFKKLCKDGSKGKKITFFLYFLCTNVD